MCQQQRVFCLPTSALCSHCIIADGKLQTRSKQDATTTMALVRREYAVYLFSFSSYYLQLKQLSFFFFFAMAIEIQGPSKHFQCTLSKICPDSQSLYPLMFAKLNNNKYDNGIVPNLFFFKYYEDIVGRSFIYTSECPNGKLDFVVHLKECICIFLTLTTKQLNSSQTFKTL